MRTQQQILRDMLDTLDQLRFMQTDAEREMIEKAEKMLQEQQGCR